jgi:glycosyltransferase involved in cell wall biosynthesis
MHVLTLTPFYPVEEDDAAGCFVSEPLAWLEKRDVRNSVIAVRPAYRKRAHANPKVPPAKWIRYWTFPGGVGLPFAGAVLFAQIVSAVRLLHATDAVDLIHAHAPLPCGHAAMLLSRELGIPYAVSVHGLDAYSDVQLTGRAGRWCRRISRSIYESSRRVICVSERVREKVLEGAGSKIRTSVVYNGVDPRLFVPSTDETAGASTVLSVGNLIPVKGHNLLLRAVASLAVDFPSLTLDIIGDGPERSRLQSLAERLKISGRVRFLERQSRQRVAEAMRRCVLFALPSSYEGLGCVYLEAMSTSKPAIGCRGQGIAEVIRHGWNGFLVGPDNEKEVALALGMLLRDESRRRNIGVAARETILESFTLEHQAENLARIYRESAG